MQFIQSKNFFFGEKLYFQHFITYGGIFWFTIL